MRKKLIRRSSLDENRLRENQDSNQALFSKTVLKLKTPTPPRLQSVQQRNEKGAFAPKQILKKDKISPLLERDDKHQNPDLTKLYVKNSDQIQFTPMPENIPKASSKLQPRRLWVVEVGSS